MIDSQLYFDENFYSLDKEAIFKLNEHDNGPINNVIAHLEKHCYGFIIYENKKPVEYLIYYINRSKDLNGFAFKLSLKLDTQVRVGLTIDFCKFLCKEYPDEDFVETFNTFQNLLRGGFEKIGYFTLGNEINDLPKDSIAFAPYGEGFVLFPTLEKLTVYRWIFDEDPQNIEIDTSKTKKVYLLLDSQNNLIKIGESFYPNLREKTLQGINPHWDLITTWVAPVSEEKYLHKFFKNKRVRGEWFNLNFNDLQLIKEKMKKYK